jgi:hypothetical protein
MGVAFIVAVVPEEMERLVGDTLTDGTTAADTVKTGVAATPPE